MNQEDTGLCVVQTALPTEAQAAELARALVQQQLAACVQLQPVRSFYVWQGQAHDEAEWLLSIKTRSALYPRLEAWLLDHPKVGPPIRQWREQGAIPRRGKIAACAGIALGYALFWISVRPHAALALGVAAGMAACALWIVTRPAPIGPA